MRRAVGAIGPVGAEKRLQTRWPTVAAETVKARRRTRLSPPKVAKIDAHTSPVMALPVALACTSVPKTAPIAPATRPASAAIHTRPRRPATASANTTTRPSTLESRK
ncbi:hypothetical protein ACH61_00747 [Rathayibacter tanaceti]|uniref:Uncharacterized protein n=1 Tax=Rathayibacter tanaceti TaxID=1671680 RepID=A0A166IBK3_9MICO|nr:hypothetical protein ACH61_00747 [Rathayibacter tanaceti]